MHHCKKQNLLQKYLYMDTISKQERETKYSYTSCTIKEKTTFIASFRISENTNLYSLAIASHVLRWCSRNPEVCLRVERHLRNILKCENLTLYWRALSFSNWLDFVELFS